MLFMSIAGCALSLAIIKVVSHKTKPTKKRKRILRKKLSYGHTKKTNTIKKIDYKYQKFIVESIDPLFGRKRFQQFKESDSGTEVCEITADEKELNRGLLFSLVTASTAAISYASFPSLLLVSLASGIYITKSVVKKAWKDLRHEKKVSNALLASLNLIGMWFGGYFVIGGIAMVIYFSGIKLIYITQDRSLKGLVNIFEKPDSVYVLIDGVEIKIPFEDLQVGDHLIIHAGQTVPVDGLIMEGLATIDQHALTGESQPAEKEEGDHVFASTMVLAGKIKIQVGKTGGESVAAQIGHILNNTVDYQMAIQSKSQQMVDKAALPSLLLAAVAWPIAGYAGMVAILGAGIGMNMRITGPIAMLNFLNIASNQSILVKDGRSLETLHKIDTVVFDKTGTLTIERPHVANIHSCGEVDEDELLTYAAAAECHQSHPIARAILQAADERGLLLPEIDQARYEMGYGIKVRIAEHLIRVGSDRYMQLEKIQIPDEIIDLQKTSQAEGYSIVMVAIDDQLAGVIELQPTIRPEAKQVIAELQRQHCEIVIISGDQEQPTRKMAEELGIDRYFANTLPENKATLVEKLQKEGRSVCFVGDGINDSIALRYADVSVSLSGATTAATDTAQILLMDESLSQLPFLLRLGHEFNTNMKAGFTSAIVPGVFTIGGVFLLHFGIPASLVIWNTGLLTGMAVAWSPVFKHRLLENQSDKEMERVDLPDDDALKTTLPNLVVK